MSFPSPCMYQGHIFISSLWEDQVFIGYHWINNKNSTSLLAQLLLPLLNLEKWLNYICWTSSILNSNGQATLYLNVSALLWCNNVKNVSGIWRGSFKIVMTLHRKWEKLYITLDIQYPTSHLHREALHLRDRFCMCTETLCRSKNQMRRA